MVFFLGIALPASAVTLLRDPDIEHALKQLAKPIFSAAGLPFSRIKIIVIKDSTMNAFIIDNNHIFIHSGLILRLKSASELQAVIAHEAAHIANGHLGQRAVNAQSARNVAGIGLALAAAAAAAGNGDAAAALSIGISSSANRVFLGHTRAQEASADHAAIRYMVRGGMDPRGAVSVMNIFVGQEVLSARRQDPYARSHPMSRDRLRTAKALVDSLGKKITPTTDHNYWFSRAKGKLSAYLRAPKWTRRRAHESAANDISLMRQAIAYHRESNTQKSISLMQKLIKSRPKDAYYHELYGQILLESRKTKAAVSAYKRSISLAPKNALILGSYGHSLLVTGNASAALRVLEKARARDYTDARTLRDMGQAYARIGKPGMAALLTAERYALRGRMKDAAIHAKRASHVLPRGSPGWQRAQDVLFAAQANLR